MECSPRRTRDMYVLPEKTVAKLQPSSCWFWSGSNIARRNRSNTGNSFNNASHSLEICSKPKGTSRLPRNSIQDRLDLGTFCTLDALRHATVAISFDWDFRKSREEAVSVCWLKSFTEDGAWVEISSEVTAELWIGISTSGRQRQAHWCAKLLMFVRRDFAWQFCLALHKDRGSQQQLTITCCTFKFNSSLAKREESL